MLNDLLDAMCLHMASLQSVVLAQCQLGRWARAKKVAPVIERVTKQKVQGNVPHTQHLSLRSNPLVKDTISLPIKVNLCLCRTRIQPRRSTDCYNSRRDRQMCVQKPTT